ncbi:flagellar basal-body MS-ring/collar protein FliF [Desulfoscipio gibsoniae]|uniref:Flagellar M-ring protein n=1 Tax=Desulfoscipio gibsoniae DSM 7213 TaxID=767817 RepID=R4KGD7_9FIRM|nr:flagellar basal-body MS-ring/collar protein FliF [Desulfoscipio gibsoniae]AGL01659.1 flagellar basal-body M-ring protein/flagellar hook-basal body protein FliF [Desulfoscipio gibsoniae DSM 7213]
MLDKLRQWWQSLNRSRKIIFVAGCTGILITIIVLGQMLLRPTYAPLFTELEPQNASKIIEQLETLQVPYHITNNGKTIEVPEDQVYKLRIQMASAGALYNSGQGFELFDEKKFGITEFEQQVGYQRALQEELRRTIVQLEEVEQARVHLVLPQESVFLDEQVVPSASIALKLKPYTKLERDQVRGIQSLVMGSMQGLTPENIHIIDMQGNVLNENMETDGAEFSTASALKNYEIRREYEKEMEQRLQQMLNRILGPARAVAMVSADLDFDRQEILQAEYGPGTILHEETLTEEGTGTTSGGIPGTDAQMPGDTMPFATDNTGSTYNREQSTIDYQVNANQQTLIKAPGTVRRLSVSVVVDGDYAQNELDSLQQVIAGAMGYDENRGDQLNVSSMNFNKDSLPNFEETPAPFSETLLDKRLIIPGAIAGTLLLMLIGFLLLRRRARRRKEMLIQQQIEEEALSQVVQEEPKKEVKVEDPIAGQRKSVKQVARERPGEVVEILKIWLRE